MYSSTSPSEVYIVFNMTRHEVLSIISIEEDNGLYIIIVQTSALVLKRRDEDLEASHRLIAESAAKVAASTVAGIVEHYQAQVILIMSHQVVMH